MFENRSLLPSLRGDRFLSPWSTGLSPFSNLRDDLIDLFDEFSDINFGMTPVLGSLAGTRNFVPRIQIQDKGSSYLVSAEVPGMNDTDMNVSIKDNNLILEGEKKSELEENRGGVYRSEFNFGSFYRAIPLTEDIDPEKITASYDNGVLKVTVEKLPEAQRQTKKIPISHEGGKTSKTIEAKSGKEVETKH